MVNFQISIPRSLKESRCCVSSKLYSWWCPVNHRPTRGTDASGRFYKVRQNFFVGVTDPTLGIYTSVVHYDIQYPTTVMAVKVPFRGNLHVYHDLASKSRETQPRPHKGPTRATGNCSLQCRDILGLSAHFASNYPLFYWKFIARFTLPPFIFIRNDF